MFNTSYRSEKSKGFSLIELMIVIGIIGILATIAMPKFKSFSAKARRSEAKVMLNHLMTLHESYIAANGDPAIDSSTQLTSDDDNGLCDTGSGCVVPNPLGFEITNCPNRGYDYQGDGIIETYIFTAVERRKNASKCSKTRRGVFVHCTSSNSGSLDRWQVKATREIENTQDGSTCT